MKSKEFDDYIDNKLEGAECACSPRGAPHSIECKGWFPGQDSYEAITEGGRVQEAIDKHNEFIEEERLTDVFWNDMMKGIVASYEEETNVKWVPNSKEVIAWIDKKFNK